MGTLSRPTYKGRHGVVRRVSRVVDSLPLARLRTGRRRRELWLVATAAPATINRELAALERMAALARHQYGLVPPFAVKRLEGEGLQRKSALAPAFPRRLLAWGGAVWSTRFGYS